MGDGGWATGIGGSGDGGLGEGVDDEAAEGGVLFLFIEALFISGAEGGSAEDLGSHAAEVGKALLAREGCRRGGCSNGFFGTLGFASKDGFAVLDLVIERRGLADGAVDGGDGGCEGDFHNCKKGVKGLINY